jgi:hypothetical protein
VAYDRYISWETIDGPFFFDPVRRRSIGLERQRRRIHSPGASTVMDSPMRPEFRWMLIYSISLMTFTDVIRAGN